MTDLELRALRRGSADQEILEEINREAIPEEERNSLEDLFATGTDGNLEILGISAEDEPAGFLVVRKHGRIRYLAYLAVRRDLRSRGIGSRALQALLGRDPEYSTVVEFEAPNPDCAGNDLRIRRKNFYLRNGFSETGWYTFYDGTEFEIGCSGRAFDEKEFGEFIGYLGTIVSDHIPKPYRREDRS